MDDRIIEDLLKRLDRLEKQMAPMIEWRNSLNGGMEYRRFVSHEQDVRLLAVEDSLKGLEVRLDAQDAPQSTVTE